MAIQEQLNLSPEQLDQLKKEIILKPLKTAEELRDWVYLFLDIYMPLGHVYKDSNSSPVESMWEIYCAVRDNTGGQVPGYTLLSSRDSYKTLSASILEILLMIHFRTTVAHAAAIESQSQKAVEYCGSFLHKVMPFLAHHGWRQTSSNKRRIELTTDKDELCYIQIIILTMRGANSSHTNLIFIDEVDLCDPKAYQEAKMIPGPFKGRLPLTIRLSTRKFAFGLMEKEIQNAPNTGEKVLRWNILDVTEHCPASRCLSDKDTQVRYIPRELPLRQITEAEFNSLEDGDKDDWERIDAYEGCTTCPLLSICKKELHDVKPKECVGDLWKPIDAIINVIRQVDPDVGEAQLLCHKPSSKGLIYPRFSVENIVTVQEAWQVISGLETPCNFETLVQYLKDLGVKIEAGVDWGYTNEFSVVVAALMPGGNSFILYNFAAPGLELDDCVKICLDIKERFGVQKWWADQAYPAYIKTFNRKGLTCPKFDKDVPLGIEAVRGRILDSNNSKWLYVLKTNENQRLIDGFGTYHWKLDAQGNATDKPDHTEESDIMDSVRYLYQNAYGSRKKMIFASASGDNRRESTDNSDRMKAKIEELAIKDKEKSKTKGSKKIFWS